MNEIIFAYQSWNNDFNYFNPNTHPSDSVIDGVKTVPYTHGGQYFTWESVNYDYGIVRRTSYEDLVKMGVLAIKSDYLDNLVTRKLLSDIKENEKYIFPISVHQVNYFLYNQQYGFDFIDPRVIEDVKNDKARIAVLFPYEGNTGIIDTDQVNSGCIILDDWCKKAGLSKHHVYFIHGNILADQFNHVVTNYTSQSVDAFTTWLPREYMATRKYEQPYFQPIDDKHLYLCYNRTSRKHRRLLISSLYFNKLFDCGLISCGEKLSIEKLEHEYYNEQQFHYFKIANELSDMTPLEIDMNLRTNNPAIDIQMDHYTRTFISLVPETHYSEGIMFRSEKIWKTLAVGHPFIILSSPGFLESLKARGYRTFGRWINESYDSEPNLLRRIHLITEELERLSAFNINELRAIREEMREDIDYNMRLVRQHYEEDMNHHGSAPLYNRVKNIWDSF